MIFAFMSYKQHFIERAVQLIEKALDFRILGLHLERLADIALTPLERGHDKPSAYTRQIRGQIELRNVSFRYAETEPFVLEDINLTIEPGEFVTIMGPSGGGKTTLMKIMLGLLEPTSGEVLIDGIPLSVIGAASLPRAGRRGHAGGPAPVRLDRRQHLLLRPEFDQQRMIACARLAGIHDEIMAMPMTYNSLSAIWAVRSPAGRNSAFCWRARSIASRASSFLDEGTAHLDVENERHINESLTQLRMTRVSVAHRPDISAGADRVIRIAKTVQSEARIPAVLAISADHRVDAVSE